MSLQSLTNMKIKCIDKTDKHYRIKSTSEGTQLLNKEVQQILYYEDRGRTKQRQASHSQKQKI